jgi:hypothetical protein
LGKYSRFSPHNGHVAMIQTRERFDRRGEVALATFAGDHEGRTGAEFHLYRNSCSIAVEIMFTAYSLG